MPRLRVHSIDVSMARPLELHNHGASAIVTWHSDAKSCGNVRPNKANEPGRNQRIVQ